MARTSNLTDFLTDVANAIREKKGTTDTIKASNFDSEIASIEGGGKYAPRYISFFNCKEADLIKELANLDTSNLTTMAQMFQNCGNLTVLDINHFDVSNVTDMSNLFSAVYKVKELDLSNWTTPNLTKTNSMFNYCTGLKKIDMRKFDFSKVTTYTSMFASVPADCEIIVKDDTAKEFVLTARSSLTNVKTVAELGGQ